jgi:hypothetical protein
MNNAKAVSLLKNYLPGTYQKRQPIRQIENRILGRYHFDRH